MIVLNSISKPNLKTHPLFLLLTVTRSIAHSSTDGGSVGVNKSVWLPLASISRLNSHETEIRRYGGPMGIAICYHDGIAFALSCFLAWRETTVSTHSTCIIFVSSRDTAIFSWVSSIDEPRVGYTIVYNGTIYTTFCEGSLRFNSHRFQTGLNNDIMLHTGAKVD